MTLDREQIRRYASVFLNDTDEALDLLAHHCLALLDTLEQAERERDEAIKHLSGPGTAATAELRARLAAVPALVEAGSAFLTAWIDASVADEEGLLAAVDQREWTAMWQRVDEAAQTFGRSITAYQETTK